MAVKKGLSKPIETIVRMAMEAAKKNKKEANNPPKNNTPPRIGGVGASPTGRTAQTGTKTLSKNTGSITGNRQNAPLGLSGVGGLTANPTGRSGIMTARQPAQRPMVTPTVNINLDRKPIQGNGTVNPVLMPKELPRSYRRSTAQDRKTMLYETNDTLLSPKEILEKYRYVTNDPDMDKNTREAAAKRGLTITGQLRDKSLLPSLVGDQASKQLISDITQLQGDLTYMQKSYARGKGFADALGLDAMGRRITENAVKKIGDAPLRQDVERRYALGAQTVADNPGSVFAGRAVGEGMKYGALAPLIEGRVLGALGKTAMSPAKMFGAKVVGQQAADTVLTTPFVIAEGMEQGKNRTEIGKDVGKQQGLDLALNLGFGGLEAGTSALRYKKEISTTTEHVLEQYNITDFYSPSNVVNGIVDRIKKSFLSTNEEIKPILNEETGLSIEVWKKGIDETFRKGSFYPQYTAEMKLAKIASVEHLPELIRTGKIRAPEAVNYHNPNNKTRFMYLQNEMKINGVDYNVYIDIKRLPDQSNRFHIHSITLKEAAHAPWDSSLAGPPLKREMATSKHSITQNGGNINPKNDFQKEISVSKEREGTDVWLDEPIFDEKTGKWIWWGKG